MSSFFAASLCVSGAATAETSVGFVYVGPVGDHGWSYQHDQARQAVEKELGVKTTYVESVAEGADAKRVIRKLASSGNDLIFTTSFGYMNPTVGEIISDADLAKFNWYVEGVSGSIPR